MTMNPFIPLASSCSSLPVYSSCTRPWRGMVSGKRGLTIPSNPSHCSPYCFTCSLATSRYSRSIFHPNPFVSGLCRHSWPALALACAEESQSFLLDFPVSPEVLSPLFLPFSRLAFRFMSIRGQYPFFALLPTTLLGVPSPSRQCTSCFPALDSSDSTRIRNILLSPPKIDSSSIQHALSFDRP